MTTMLLKRDLIARGWTDRLISDLLGGPDQQPHRRGGGHYCLFDEQRVQNAEQGVAFREHQEKRAAVLDKRACNVDRRRKALAARYSNWREAIPKACEALFNLNRYAKYESCRTENRQEIYALKNEFIALLYRLGASIQVNEHIVHRPELECWRCAGSGLWVSYCGNYSGDCDRCDGTGTYRESRDDTFIVFRFCVSGQTYCWHQPAELITYPVVLTAAAEQAELVPEEKPLNLSPSRFADAKRLLRFVIEGERAALMGKAADEAKTGS